MTGGNTVEGAEGVLHVQIQQAKDLEKHANTYCVVTASFNKQRFKTKVIKKSNNPTWNQEVTFFIGSIAPHTVTLKLWAKDRWGRDDNLGETTIPLKGLENGDKKEAWHDLEKKKEKVRAKMLVTLHFPVKKPEKDEKQAKEVGGKEVHLTKKDRRVDECYEFGDELGRGGFSIVKKATNRDNGEIFAIKIIEKKEQTEEELNLLHREIDIMRKLKHKNIIGLFEVYDEKENIYLVMELVTGGELFDQIVSRGTYSEADAANVIRQILEAVEYMHENGIAHRDLKPENLLCSGQNNEIIKVTDFGLSKDFGNASLRTSCGTPDYVAPEVLKGQPYDNMVDIWSIGVITYILLCGFPPFYGNNDQQIFEKILKADYDFPSPDWDTISAEAKEFISAILVLDYNKRPNAKEALAAPWLRDKASSESLQRMESFKQSMGKYNTTRKNNNKN